jgi:S-adenosylmethionine synthetase
MSEYQLDPYNVLETYLHSQSDYEDIVEACKAYGRSVRDQTLEWASKHAEINFTTAYMEEIDLEICHHNIDEGSILAGKTSKDLEI